jgi:hypothetical protein
MKNAVTDYAITRPMTEWHRALAIPLALSVVVVDIFVKWLGHGRSWHRCPTVWAHLRAILGAIMRTERASG